MLGKLHWIIYADAAGLCSLAIILLLLAAFSEDEIAAPSFLASGLLLFLVAIPTA